ncbi:MAG: hypothetical protein ACYTEO_15690 [Planctomycetota bacterium]
MRQVVNQATRAVMNQLSQDGADIQATGREKNEVYQQGQFDLAQHYGFRSSPPQGTEHIRMQCGGGAVSVAERTTRPSQLGSMASGEAALYDSSGNIIWMRKSNGIEIRHSGSTVTKNYKGGSAKAVALNGDTVNENAALRTWINAITAIVGPVFTGPAIGTVNASSTTLEAE